MHILDRFRAAPAAPPETSAPAPGPDLEILELVRQFQEERLQDIAKIADRAGRNGARVAFAERERDQWRRYARQLVQICMANGLELRRAPDVD